MNKIHLRILGAICLLLCVILLTTTGSVWASVSRQTTNTVNLLLQNGTVQQAPQSVNMQIIRNLLLQDNQEGQRTQIFLPLVRR